jgi:hypothetical protein
MLYKEFTFENKFTIRYKNISAILFFGRIIYTYLPNINHRKLGYVENLAKSVSGI